jgi:hypothetical protein
MTWTAHIVLTLCYRSWRMKGRVFGFKPYSVAVKAFGNFAELKTFDVEIRDGAIWLAAAERG